MFVGILPKLARIRPEEASLWVDRLPARFEPRKMRLRIAKFWSRADPDAASAWIEGLEATATELERLRGVHRKELEGAPRR